MVPVEVEVAQLEAEAEESSSLVQAVGLEWCREVASCGEATPLAGM